MWTSPSPPSSGPSATTRSPTATPLPASTWTRRRVAAWPTGPSSARCWMPPAVPTPPSRRSWCGSSRASPASASTPLPSSRCSAAAASASFLSPSTPMTPPRASSWRPSSRAWTNFIRRILLKKLRGECASPPRAGSSSRRGRPSATGESRSATEQRSVPRWRSTRPPPRSCGRCSKARCGETASRGSAAT